MTLLQTGQLEVIDYRVQLTWSGCFEKGQVGASVKEIRSDSDLERRISMKEQLLHFDLKNMD